MRMAKTFGKTTNYFSKRQEVKKKYIFVYEGSKTEVQYFNALNESRSEIGLDPLIDMVPLLRSVVNETEGHPKRILALLNEYLERYNTVKVYIDKILDFCYDNLGVSENSVYSIRILKKNLEAFFASKGLFLNDDIPKNWNVFEEISLFLEEQLKISSQIKKLRKYILGQQITYFKEIDCVCVVVDRDKDSFYKSQYTEILNACLESDYRLYVTNPTFEFWLLLHSDKVFSYDRNKLLKNPKRSNHKRYLEIVLSDVFFGYRKEQIKAKRFVVNVRKAIKNARSYCENIYGLEHSLGSNLGLLINEMLSLKA